MDAPEVSCGFPRPAISTACLDDEFLQRAYEIVPPHKDKNITLRQRAKDKTATRGGSLRLFVAEREQARYSAKLNFNAVSAFTSVALSVAGTARHSDGARLVSVAAWDQ
jgi:hypothetical protein